MNASNDVANFSFWWKKDINPFRKALARSFVKQKCIEDLLHTVSILLKVGERVGIPLRWRSVSFGVREHWV